MAQTTKIDVPRLDSSPESPKIHPQGEENSGEVMRVNNLTDIVSGTAQHIETAYTPNLKDNSKAILRRDEISETNNCVIAQEPIAQGEIIAIFEGPIYQADQISALPSKYLQDHVVQIGEHDYLLNQKGLAHLLNHSCNPNCGIVDGVKIVTMRDIAQGEQLTWDYESTEDSDWEMAKCECGGADCRGQIRAFRYMPMKQRKKLEKYISPWLLEKYKSQVEFKSIPSEEITIEDINEFSDFIRWVFCNSEEWEEYAYCINCDPKKEHGERMSARDAFKLANGKDATLEKLNDPSNLPNCNCCGTKMELFMDPEATFNTLFKKLKLSEDAYLTTMRNGLGKIVGVTYVYFDNIKDLFEKEWGEIYSYANEKTKPNKKRPYQNFKQKLSNALPKDNMYGIEPGENIPDDTLLICANLIAIHPDYRGKGYYSQLATQTCLSADATKLSKYYVVAESVKKTKAHQLLLRGGAIEIPGVLNTIDDVSNLKDDDYLIVAYELENYMKEFFRVMMEG